jgi:ABC-type nitrate/sulfonate/bicarbonate transport system substrate-binding protein
MFERRIGRLLGALLIGVPLLAACAPATPATPAAPSAPAAPAGAAAPAPAAAPATLTKVTMGQTGASPQSWPLYVGQNKGFYTAEGLEIENVILSASSTQTQALIAGDLQLNTYSVDSLAKAVVAGAPLKLVGGVQEIPNFQLIVAPEIRGFADLRGKTIGAGSPGGYFDIVLRGMLMANGLGPNDFQVFSVSNPRARAPAIKTGQLAGALIGGPDDALALADGLKSLGYVHESIPDVQYSGYTVADAWARANEPLVVAFLRGTLRSLAWLRDPANKEEAKQIYGQVGDLPPEYLDVIYDQMVVQKMLNLDARPNLKGIETVLGMAVQQGALDTIPPLNTWVDLSYLEKASLPSR